MSIRSSLESFSLPELFQIIGSGRKSGRLTFTPNFKNNNLSFNTTFELWFKEGNFVAIVNYSKYQALIDNIQNNAWIDSRVLVKAKYSCPANKPFGIYIQEENLLDELQIDLLFAQQINEVKQLFAVKHGWFNFEEVNQKNQITRDGETFPWKEMTGKQKMVTELSFEVMRDFSDWSRFAEDIPSADAGLQKLAPSWDIQLTNIEQNLWDMANGSISLKKIAKQQGFDLKTLQYTTLSMIFAGLVEEVPVVHPSQEFTSSSLEREHFNLREENNIAVKTKTKTTISDSLINNLVSFLKDKF